MDNTTVNPTNTENIATKFCKHCGNKIPVDAVLCTACGRQVEELHSNNNSQPNIVINNSNNNSNVNANMGMGIVGRPRNKWIALALCVFLGFFGAHKFYEGKGGMGIIYLLTGGLFFFGVFIDFFSILSKPNPYYVY